MKPQLDRLFQEKLAMHEMPPGAAVWARIGSRDRRRGRWSVAKIAAAAGIALIAGYPVGTTPELAKAPATGTSAPALAAAVLPVIEPGPCANAERRTVAQTVAPSAENDARIAAAKPVDAAAEIATTDSTAAQAAPRRADPAVAVGSVGNTLIVTAEDSRHYLTKKYAPRATSGKRKASVIKKALRKAGDLKNNQNPFGDLRQIKNELLALDLRTDRRGQKKQ